MKYFILPFALFNTLLLAYAQESFTCEQEFNLQGTTCTPCQQTLHKYPFIDIYSITNKQPPSDKCLIIPLFQYYLSEGNAASTPDTLLDPVNVNNALDKTCADTANGACSEDHVVSTYTEVDKNCDAELNNYFTTGTTDIIGTKAFTTLIVFYTAIPVRSFYCGKIGNARDNLKEFRDKHPITPNLQKALANSTKAIDEYDAKCGTSSAKSTIKSNGHRIINDFGNYSGILMGLIVFYMNFM
ncbi:5122_t:CDS:2 [Funneliformis geosporum]|nr:5122_t:CDS:2 [Funneliformis geosporum]